MPETVIFLGPSLCRADAESILPATYLPPIRRGDLAQLPQLVSRIGIIDGEFYQSLAVSPKEILALLDRGVKVFGASSMGALRAAETHGFGTIGVGEIFAMFRDGILDGDDEVALAYEPNSYVKLSEPLVNIRRALECAAKAKMIDDREREWLTAEMKAAYFPRRSYKALERLCPALTGYLRNAPLPDLKRDDARELLIAMRDAAGAPSQTAHQEQPTRALAP